MSLEKTIAHDLLSIGAVFLRPDEPFTWASGIKSPIYCDNRLTLTAPAVRTHVEEGLVDLICKHYPNVEVLMGTSTAGIAHAAIVGHLMGLPMWWRPCGRPAPRCWALSPSSPTACKRALTAWLRPMSSTTASPTSTPCAKWPQRRGRSSRRTSSGSRSSAPTPLTRAGSKAEISRRASAPACLPRLP